MRTNSGEQGFSLLEILVAVTIMGLAYVAILQNFSMSARSIVAMEAERSATMDRSLAFEWTLLALDLGDQDAADGAEILAEGSRYDLALLRDEEDEFMTLRLKKK